MARSSGRPRTFNVRVSRSVAGEEHFDNLLSKHVQMSGAWSKALGILAQWAQSEGAVTPGTTISIIDTNDGGKLFTATYLGFEPNLLSEESGQ